jgi:autotransporter-associated beta strand protein
MKTQSSRLKIPVIAIVMAFGIAAIIQPAVAATTNYLNLASVASGGSYGLDNLYWNTTSETATPLVDYVASDAMCIGQNPSDYNGYSFAINFNYSASTHVTGSGGSSIIIGSTNTIVTFNGADNDYLDAATTISVAQGSTLIEDVDWDSLGLNFDSQTVTLNGGGTITFQTPIGINSSGLITENMPGGTVNLTVGLPSKDDFTGGYTLTAGSLIFTTGASANAFGGFPSGKNLTLNSGTIDNTSGSPIALTWAGGGVSIGGNFTFNGGSSLSFGSAPVTLTGTPTVTVNAHTLTFGGPVSGSGAGLTVTGNGTLALASPGSYAGTTFVAGSTLALTGTGSISQSALVASNATLDLSGLTVPSVNPSLSLSNSIVNISIPQNPTTNEITTTLNLGGATNILNVLSLPVITGYPMQYVLASYGTLNGAFNIGLGSLPAAATPFSGYITNISGLIELVITSGAVPARQLTWVGADSNNPHNWDVQGSLNWVTSGGPATTYNQGDIVTFNDSASGQTNIYLVGTLTPGILTVSNSVLAYNLGASGTDGGSISGATELTKEGTNLLILNDNGGNNFTGGLIISNGTVQVGNGDSRGSPGAGPIFDNGTLVFDDSSRDSALQNDISGTGTIVQEGADTLQLAGTNTFSGSVLVTSTSTLQLGAALALSGNPVTTISNGAVLDLNGFTAGGIMMVQGNGTGSGALINSSANAPANDIGLTNLTMTGDTTIGITGNRFDLRSPGGPTGNPGGTTLSTGGQPYNLVKTGSGGTGVFGLVSADVDPALANIDIQQGDLQMTGNTTGLGNPADTLTIENGAEFELYAETNQVNKVIVFNDGATLLNSSAVNTIIGPMNITNSSGGQNCYFEINGTSLVLSNTLTGNGMIFTYIATNSIYLNGNSPAFAGGIYMNTPSTIVVDGVFSNALTIDASGSGCSLVVNGQVLGAEIGPDFPGVISGSGSMNCTVDSAAPIYPGAAGVVGTMTVGNLILDGSSITFDLNPNTTPGGGINDLIAVTNLTVNSCTLNVNPLGLLPTGAKYELFTYSGTLAMNGSFGIVNSGGYIYTIDTSTQGVVNLVVAGGPPQWNGGSTQDSDWSDSANWGGSTLAANDLLYFAGNNRLNSTNDTAANTAYSSIDFFSGAGAFVLNGNAITLAGSNIVNNSTAAQTFDLPLAYGAPQIFNGAAGPLIIGGGITNTASTTTNYLTLTGSGILTNLLYSLNATGTNLLAVTGAGANWTLLDNPSSIPMVVPWSLQISNGTFNFGSAGSAPTLTSLTIHNVPADNQLGDVANSTATLNINNGTLTLNTLNTGQALNSTGIVNQAGGTVFLGPVGSVAADYFQGANGGNAGEVSVVTISGGTMNLGSTTNLHEGTFFVASRGNGTLTVSGQGALNCSALDLSRDAQGNTFGSVGVVNLNGGSITATRVGTATVNSQAGPSTNGVNPSATFNFNGGTLRAAAASTNFYQGNVASPAIPITSIVQAGGAIIDSSNFAVAVLEPLQHDSTLGATPDGGLTKLGAGTLTLTVAGTYTGPTVVGNGTLAVNGSLADTLGTIVETNGTLAGTGNVGGNVTVNIGGAVAPGGAGVTGTLTVAGNVSLSGNTDINLNAATPTNSVLSAGGAITYGGTLTVTNLAGTLALGDSFELIAPGGGSIGAFSATNLPELNAGLAWNWNPSAGTLSVVQGSSFPPTAPPVIKGFSIAGGNVTISGTNAQAGATYYLLTSTNLLLPLSQWTAVSTNVATGANNFSFIGTNAVSPNSPKQFYILSSTNN